MPGQIVEFTVEGSAAQGYLSRPDAGGGTLRLFRQHPGVTTP